MILVRKLTITLKANSPNLDLEYEMGNKCINDWVKANLISVAKKIGYALYL